MYKFNRLKKINRVYTDGQKDYWDDLIVLDDKTIKSSQYKYS